MFSGLPNDYSIAVRTPDPIIVKIQPSEALIAVFAGVLIIAAAWVKRKY